MNYAIDAACAVGGLILLSIVIWLVKSTLVYINNESYGVVEKVWDLRGRNRTGFMALNGEPGFQPEILLGGLHWFIPFMYRVHRQRLITVEGIANVFSRVGDPMRDGQALAKFPEGTSYNDVTSFISKGGQQGPQRAILREGTYAINTAAFAVLTSDHVYTVDIGEGNDSFDKMWRALDARKAFDPLVLDEDAVGIVTVNDGPSLEHGEIVAPTVGKGDVSLDHNSYQDIEKFLKAGGRRGRQEQVLVEGRYYINGWFAIVEKVSKQIIKLGEAGVVNSYTGTVGDDISGDDYTYGRLAETGQKGIWAEPFYPGKYAINPYAMNVVTVPTTNIVLRWETGRSETHGFDKNLSEIKLITKDGFEPIIGLAMVIHIYPKDAPFVIQQFSDIPKLVEQTFDPIVSSWLKDATQQVTLLELISARSELQKNAMVEIGERFRAYNVNVQEIVLGTPRSESGDNTIENVLSQVRDRQFAVEQRITLAAQQETAGVARQFNEAEAVASNQASLTQSKIAVEIASNEGAALVQRESKAKEATILKAEAAARQIELEGDAEAAKITAIGAAEASAVAAQVEAYGGSQAALQKAIAQIVADALQNSQQPLVPQMIVGEGGAANLPAALLSLFTAKQIQPTV